MQEQRETFEAFYTRSHTLYARLVGKVLQHNLVHMIEDVLQDGYLKIWRAWEKRPPEDDQLVPWGIRILRNTAIDAWRAVYGNPKRINSRWPRILTVSLEYFTDDFFESTREGELDPLDISIERESEREERDRLERVLVQLKASDRLLLTLYRTDLPYKVLSSKTGESSSIMKQRKHRAIKAAHEIARKEQVS